MKQRPPQPLRPDAQAGFTLIELLVVLGIIALLLTLSVPRYFSSVERSKEAVLVANLRLTRETIVKYYGDTGRYPDSLNQLVEKQYLRSLPLDPVTGSAATWIIVAPTPGIQGEVYDIKSGAPGLDRDGHAFADL
ncbi:MAG: type secretion system protein [Herbaspirillum sp.]|nr:type secretion system protein [Herbaspirillum sp.]